MNNMRKVASAMIDNTKNELTTTIDNVFNNLVVSKNAQLPENIFVEYFLDFFRNYNTGNLNEPLNLKWVELSGSPYNSVDILNANGDIIYTVPPLMVHPDLEGKPIEDFNFSKMVGEYKLRSNRLQTDADNYVHKQLDGLDKQITPPDMVDIQAHWNAIFARYDTKVKVPDVIKLTVAPSNADDFIDYD